MNWKKWLLAVLAAALLAFGADWAAWRLDPTMVNVRQSGETTEIDPVFCGLFDSEIIDGMLTVHDDGYPMVHFLVSGTLQSVVIRLSEPAAEDIHLQVFYMGENVPMTEENSVSCTLFKGQKTAGVDIPEEEYSLIRIDFNQNMPLESFSVSPEPLRTTRTPYAPVWWRIGAAVAAVALLAFLWLGVAPVRRGLTAVYDHTLNPEKRPIAIDIIYGTAGLAMFLHHIYVTLYFWELPYGAGVFGTAWWVLAGVSLLLGRMWRDKGFWFLAAFFLLKVLRVYVPSPGSLYQVSDILTTTVYAFFFCYAYGRALRPRLRRPFLSAFCALWTAATTVLCALGLYSAWTGTPVANLTGYAIEVRADWDHRLFLFYYAVVSGILSAAGASVALVGFSLTKQKWAKVLYTFGMLVMLLTGGLTATRTGFVLAGVAFSLAFCIMLYKRFIVPGGRRGYRLPAWKGAVLALCFVALTLGLAFAQTYIVDGFKAVQARGGLLISDALAESTARKVTQIPHRGFTNASSVDGLLTGRTQIWSSVLKDLTSDSTGLLWGRSILDPMLGVWNIMHTIYGTVVEHCHNLYLMIMLESGIPGLVLFLGALVCFAVHALRLILNPDLPAWQRLLPVPAAALLVSELVECATHVNFDYPQMTVLYVFLGFTAAVGASVREERKTGYSPRHAKNQDR